MLLTVSAVEGDLLLVPLDMRLRGSEPFVRYNQIFFYKLSYFTIDSAVNMAPILVSSAQVVCVPEFGVAEPSV